MWWRQSWFSLNGTIGLQGQERGALLRHPAPQHQPTDPCTTLVLAYNSAKLLRDPVSLDAGVAEEQDFEWQPNPSGECRLEDCSAALNVSTLCPPSIILSLKHGGKF